MNLPLWVYEDGSIADEDFLLEHQGKKFQVRQTSEGNWIGYENGFLSATRGWSSDLVAVAPTLDALKVEIDRLLPLRKKFGSNYKRVCCDQAEIVPCVCEWSYKCPIHHPDGIHIGTHD